MPKTTRIERMTIISPDREMVDEMRDWLRPYSSLAQIDAFTSLKVAVPMLAKFPCSLMLVADRFPEAVGVSLFDGLNRLSPEAQIYMLASEQTPIPGMSIAARRNPRLHYFPQPWDRQSLLTYLEASLRRQIPANTTAVVLDEPQREEVSRQLDELQESLSPRSIYLTTDLGQVLAYRGDTEFAQIGKISLLLGGSFAALQQVGMTLGDLSPANSLIQRQSETEDIYVIGIGDRALLVLLFSHSPYTPRLGTIAYYARKKARILAKILFSTYDGRSSRLPTSEVEEAPNSEFETLLARSGEPTKETKKAPGRLLSFTRAFEEGLVTTGLIDRFQDQQQQGIKKLITHLSKPAPAANGNGNHP